MVEIVKLIATELKAEIEVYPIDTGDHEFSTGIVIIKVIADTLNATIEPHAIFDSGNKDEKLYIGRIHDEVDTIHAQFDFSTELYEVESNVLAISFNLIIVWIFQVIILLGVYSSYSLSQKLKNDGISNIDGPKELIEVLESGERHFVSTTASDWFYEDHPLSILAKEYCNLVPMDDPLALVSTHLIFRKDSPLVAPVNEAISLNRMVILRIFRKQVLVCFPLTFNPYCRYMDYQKRIDNPACHKLQAPIDMPVYGLSLRLLGP
ncbi:hypothetical protein M3Y99_00834600 [Aphelenchoides fujianensis]|nr:hypothetical protein M3Y99_00834600 [Aphelenchoides fujianensis]